MAAILVVDDEPHIRKMVHLALSKDGHAVETAASGAEGLNRFGDGSTWDEMLVDERMPGMSGREVVAEARRRDPSARIVMMTAFDTPDLAAAAVQEGATDFLAKPFTAEALRHAMAVVLGRPRLPSQGAAAPGAVTHEGPGTERASTSYWVNGYGFWRVPPPEPSGVEVPSGVRVMRTFRVSGPLDDRSRCVVAVMPHIEQEVAEAAGRPLPDDHTVWDLVCRFALSAYLWRYGVAPPAVLPVYELSSDELEDVRRVAA